VSWYLLEKRVERAALAVMPRLDARHVEAHGVLPRRNVFDLIRRREQERRRLVDDPADQRWAGDAVDTRLLDEDPLHP
jgi:hypothetical protein